MTTVITSDYTLRIQTTWNHLFIKHILKQYPNLEYVLHFIQGIYNVKQHYNIMFTGDCYVQMECIPNICCQLLMIEADSL
jgi:hypothetical protein